jgi:DNA-binding beta-propeller fold protein YncE
MNPIRSTIYRSACTNLSTAFLICALSVSASAQIILASIPIPTASAGQVAVNPALNKIYAGGGPNAGGSSLTVIDGTTFAVVTTISPSAGVSVDMKNDNVWTGTLTAADVAVYAGSNNVEISSTKVTACPAAVTFDCRRRMWVASQCGTGNDPVWVFDADNFKLIDGPIASGGAIAQSPAVNPDTEKLYVTSGGVSKEINPTTFAVSNTTFGTVLAIDSNSNKLFATSGNNLQIVLGHNDTISTTVKLTYTPAAIGVDNAMAHVYLVNPAGNFIDVYNEVGKKLATFLLGTDNQPASLAVDSARGRLYVDVLNTGTNSWSLDVIEDLSTVRQCAIPGGCDY